MPENKSPEEVKAQIERDTYGCGTQFPPTQASVPQSRDLDRYLSSRQKQLGQPNSTAKAADFGAKSSRDKLYQHEQGYTPVSRDARKDNYSKYSGGPKASLVDPIARWKQEPPQEMPWDGVGAVAQGRNEKGKGKGPRSGNTSSVGGVEGSSEGARSSRSWPR